MKQSAILLGLMGLGLVVVALGATWLLLRDERPDIDALRIQALVRNTSSTPSPPPTAESIASVERAVSPGGLIDISIQRFVLRAGHYPRTLNDLVTRPYDLPDTASWDGPYISNARLISDPWGNTYQIESPGRHNPSGYDLWSKGPDGVDLTFDDIGNW